MKNDRRLLVVNAGSMDDKMFKIMFFLWRRTDMSPADFSRYYEERHTGNNARIRPASADYRRNYPALDDDWTDAAGLRNLGDFDVMSENWYPDRERFQSVLTALTESPGREILAEDEAKFEIREKKKVFVVDEVGTSVYGTPEYEVRALRNEAGRFKLVRFVKSATALSPPEFRSRYEREEAPAIGEAFKACVEYRRSYLVFDDPMTFTGIMSNAIGRTDTAVQPAKASFDCDLIEEIWYENRHSAAADLANYSARRDREISNGDSAVDNSHSPIVVMREQRTQRPPLL